MRWSFREAPRSAWNSGSGAQALLRERGRGSPFERCACRSFPAPCCSICSTVATRTGGVSPPIGTSAMPPRTRRARASRSEPPAPASARPRSTSRADWARPPRLTRDGHMVGALVAVNACGSVNVGTGPQFWAAPFEVDGEFGGLGFPAAVPPAALIPVAKGRPGENHHNRDRRHRCNADQGADQAAGGDGAGWARPSDLPPLTPRLTAIPCSQRRPAAGHLRTRSMSSPSWAPSPRTRSPARSPRGVFEATALPGGIPSWRDTHGARFLHR